MPALSILRKPLPEIIKRHAGDAAFYWNQWDKSKYSFVIDAERLAQSTGNEPATQAFKKGMSTSVIKGKTYFADWSQDVKVEGLNVCCNFHATTHNHG